MDYSSLEVEDDSLEDLNVSTSKVKIESLEKKIVVLETELDVRQMKINILKTENHRLMKEYEDHLCLRCKKIMIMEDEQIDVRNNASSSETNKDAFLNEGESEEQILEEEEEVPSKMDENVMEQGVKQVKEFECEKKGRDDGLKLINDFKERMNHDQVKQIYSCGFPGCAFKCTLKIALNKHILTHSNGKPYKCHEEGCGRRFTHLTGLSIHKKVHLVKLINGTNKQQTTRNK